MSVQSEKLLKIMMKFGVSVYTLKCFKFSDDI